MASLFSELKRRNVIRVGLAYIIAAWLLLQVADVVLNNIVAPDWVFQAILLVVVLGFALALIFAENDILFAPIIRSSILF